jgi:hypothetical protein
MPRYKFLRESLKGIEDNDSINLLTILESNGLDDALWTLQATAENCDKVARLMAADFAEEVLPIWKKYSDDPRPKLAIQAARDFAHRLITREELAAARDAARDAADAARDAAGAAARAAAWAAAWAAARDAARTAAWDAAWAKQKEIFVRYLQPEVQL